MRENIQIGVYHGCSNCSTHKCCAHSGGFVLAPYATYPWILPEEAAIIAKIVGHSDFYLPPLHGERFGRLIRDHTDNCPFLLPEGCGIFDHRPFDCRMYPFDILHKNGEYYLIRYTNLCDTNLQFDDNIDQIIEMARPYYKEYSLDEEQLLTTHLKIRLFPEQ